MKKISKKTSAKKAAAPKKTAPKTVAAKKVAAKKKAAPKKLGAAVPAHGVPLIERVIAEVEKKGLDVLGRCGLPPRSKPVPVPPAILETLTFPGGAPLSPSLKRWLAFDASWLDWFEDPKYPVFRPQPLAEYADDEYGMTWGYEDVGKKLVDGQCYGLHFGADSRRFLHVGKPDSTGEYPVLLLDTDDVPYIGVEYPGIDVYLGVHAGLIDDGDCYGSLADDARYRARMKEHADQTLAGRNGFELGNDVSFDGEGNPIEYLHVRRGQAPPEGAVQIKNPLTGEPTYFKLVKPG